MWGRKELSRSNLWNAVVDKRQSPINTTERWLLRTVHTKRCAPNYRRFPLTRILPCLRQKQRITSRYNDLINLKRTAGWTRAAAVTLARIHTHVIIYKYINQNSFTCYYQFSPIECAGASGGLSARPNDTFAVVPDTGEKLTATRGRYLERHNLRIQGENVGLSLIHI